jgi:hypothetical protein
MNNFLNKVTKKLWHEYQVDDAAIELTHVKSIVFLERLFSISIDYIFDYDKL